MDKSGGYYNYIRGDGTWSTSDPTPISDLANGDNPFALNGIGAMLFLYKSPEGPASRYVVNKDGTYFCVYSNNPNQFGKVYPITDWAGGGLPFASGTVGAGIGFYLGVKPFYILFNGEGTQYAISGDVYGKGTHEFIGPFDL